MIEQALAYNKETFGIEDFELVQRDGMFVLQVDFTVGIHAGIYSTGAVEFQTTKPIKQKRLGATVGIINAFARHMEHYNENPQEPNVADGSTSPNS
ncbi:hypothetical protein SBP1_gp106 [Vibrio virus vB_VspP_SBP1]|uniref:Uncharacterized protein n=1 Tax=Vibrio virus vB_VspP_SBP1 TaxID=2500581 RepID=A0A3T0IIQ3_9CAUD|nr:hypothetical protein KNU36_gp023 [Vibrio virus vB_VspP_SBP1]AZU99698.1 hypothetical protein SBP1_gp106 [Vibrio virus vB_VspP_SBP1]